MVINGQLGCYYFMTRVTFQKLVSQLVPQYCDCKILHYSSSASIASVVSDSWASCQSVITAAKLVSK